MKYSDRAKDIFRQEITELERLSETVNGDFDAVVEVILACQGKLVLMGIGKTGIIAHKIASSLASTGTPAVFVNAAEAVHGDLGIIAPEDIVMLVSNSGATNEILNVLAPIRRIGCKMIAMTGNPQSPLAKDCDLVLSVHVDHEACPLGLAPTSSTTATLVMGDALMICLMEQRHFQAENFSLYHPGGALGRQLLGKVSNRMSTRVPRVSIDTPFRELVAEVTDKHMGTTFVYDGNHPVGIITDGDIRRTIQHCLADRPEQSVGKKYEDLSRVKAGDIMSRGYKRIPQQALLTEALELLDKYNITTLAVTSTKDADDIIGILSIHHIIDFVN